MPSSTTMNHELQLCCQIHHSTVEAIYISLSFTINKNQTSHKLSPDGISLIWKQVKVE